MRFERDDAKVGLLVLASLLIFSSVLFHRGLKALLGKEKNLIVKLENASDLVAGMEVQLQGHRVGQVREIKLVPEGVRYYFLATLSLRPDISLWKGTKAVQNSKVLGGATLELILPESDQRREMLPANAVIECEQGSSLKDLIAHIQALTDNINGLVTDLRGPIKQKGLGSLLENQEVKRVLQSVHQTLEETQALMKSGRSAIHQTSEAAERDMKSLEALLGQVRELLANRKPEIEGTLVNLEKSTREFGHLGQSAKELVQRVGPESEAVLKALQRNLQASEELLQLLKQKPSRLLWGTPTPKDKEAAQKAYEEGKSRQKPNP